MDTQNQESLGELTPKEIKIIRQKIGTAPSNPPNTTNDAGAIAAGKFWSPYSS